MHAPLAVIVGNLVMKFHIIFKLWLFSIVGKMPH